MVHRQIIIMNKRSAVRRGLLGLLALAMLLMSLTISRQQVLGPLHTHAEAGLISAMLKWPGLKRLAHWRAHAQQQGGGLIVVVNATQAVSAWPARASLMMASAAHVHAEPQRHQHRPGEAGVVVALDSEAAGIDGTAGSPWLPVLGGPSLIASLADPASRRSEWPAGSAATFASWRAAPPLRPPAG